MAEENNKSMDKLFRSAMMGYRKDDVYHFINEISENFEKELAQRDEKIRTLSEELSVKSERLEKLEADYAAVEKIKSEEMNIIAAARVKGQQALDEAKEQAQKTMADAKDFAEKNVKEAQEKATGILEAGKREYEELRQSLEAQLNEKREVLSRAKDELSQFKASTTDFMKQFVDTLSDLSKKE